MMIEETEQNKSTTDKAYQYLMEEMRKGNILPGNSLNLKEIRNKLGISSTPLSNALIRLEAEGFVTIFPRSKVLVNKLELHDFRMLYEIIGTIEYSLIFEVINSYTENVIQKMDNYNHEMEKAVLNGNIKKYDEFHYKFHEVFLEQNNNLFASRILKPIKNRLWDFPRHNFMFDWYLEAVKEHKQIIMAIKERDLQKLKTIIKDFHWGYDNCKSFLIVEYNLEE